MPARTQLTGTPRGKVPRRSGRTGPGWSCTPVAAPSILGLFGFFAATLLVGPTWRAGGATTPSPILIFPFAIMLGGVAQFLAGMWAYRARDGIATAAHGIWGAFWLALGLYQLLVTTGNLPALTATRRVLRVLVHPAGDDHAQPRAGRAARERRPVRRAGHAGDGRGFTAAGFISGTHWPEIVGGWLFVFSAGFAWYTASAMVLEGAFRRVVLPTFKWSKDENIPTRHVLYPIEYADGMPGSRVGQ